MHLAGVFLHPCTRVAPQRSNFIFGHNNCLAIVQLHIVEASTDNPRAWRNTPLIAPIVAISNDYSLSTSKQHLMTSLRILLLIKQDKTNK